MRAELYECYRRLGRIVASAGTGRGRRESDPLVPRRLEPIAVLIAAKIRDLALEVEATRPH